MKEREGVSSLSLTHDLLPIVDIEGMGGHGLQASAQHVVVVTDGLGMLAERLRHDRR